MTVALSDKNTRRADEAERARHIAAGEAVAFATMLLNLLNGAEAAQHRSEHQPEPPATEPTPPPRQHTPGTRRAPGRPPRLRIRPRTLQQCYPRPIMGRATRTSMPARSRRQ